jgi:hypothetical protein
MPMELGTKWQLARGYDAFGLIGTTLTELDWKKLICFERVVPISPNAS